jgi:prephenate dehydrogenase
MDVGSTKKTVMKVARRRRFIGAHPIAGTERSGPEAGDPDLFKGRRCFLSVNPGTSYPDRKRITQIWKRIGAKVVLIDPARHDRLFAAISHLPHALSFSFVRTLTPTLRREGIRRWAEGSFRDATRVASSPEGIWTDIFLENRSEVIPSIDRVRHELLRLRNLLQPGNPVLLRRWLVQARRRKEALL